MAGSRSKRRGRGRSRKGRPKPSQAGAPPAGEATPPKGETRGEAAAATASRRAQRPRRSDREQRPFRDPLSVGERPPAPWHPLPLSELLILVGAIGTIVAFRRGHPSSGPLLFASLGAVAIGTLEVTLREHRSGYRSHTLLLAFLPVLVFHSAVLLGISFFTPVPRLLNVALLAVDAALFAVLYKVLRAHFKDARARVISRR